MWRVVDEEVTWWVPLLEVCRLGILGVVVRISKKLRVKLRRVVPGDSSPVPNGLVDDEGTRGMNE